MKSDQSWVYMSPRFQETIQAIGKLTTLSSKWATVLVAGIALVLILRRFAQNRLRLPPGPPNLPVIGALLSMRSDLYRVLAEYSQKYGPVVYYKLGSLPVVAVSSAELAEEVMRHKDMEFASRAHSTILYTLAQYFGFGASNIAFSPYTPHLRQIRKVSTKELLTSAKLSSSEQVRWEEQGEMVKEVEHLSKEGSEFNIREVLLTMSMNMTCRMLFGKRYYGKNVTMTKDLIEFQSLMEEMVTLAGKPNLSDVFPALRWLDPQGLTAKFKALHAKQERIMKNIVEDHRRAAREASEYRLSAPKVKDFVDVMLSLEGDDKLSDRSIMAIISDMLNGTIDSTTTLVQWGLIELIRNPDVMAKLHKELDEAVGKERAMVEADLSKLPYLEAVVKEILRLYPPVPLLIPRQNEKATTLQSYFIPKHSSIFVNVWAIGRDPKVWDNADQFIPERFLDSKIHVVGNDYKFTPFGAGRRQCIGITMGMLLVERTLGCLVHSFDFLPPEGKTRFDISNEDEPGMVLMAKHPLVCRAVPRLPSLAVYYTHQN